eukprot:bmy_18221T0
MILDAESQIIQLIATVWFRDLVQEEEQLMEEKKKKKDDKKKKEAAQKKATEQKIKGTLFKAIFYSFFIKGRLLICIFIHLQDGREK